VKNGKVNNHATITMYVKPEDKGAFDEYEKALPSKNIKLVRKIV